MPTSFLPIRYHPLKSPMGDAAQNQGIEKIKKADVISTFHYKRIKESKKM